MQFFPLTIKQHIVRRTCPWLAALCVLVGRTGFGAPVDTFYNDGTYTSTANFEATNFVNDYGGTFDVSIGLQNGWLNDLFQAWSYTRNYTNNGEMDANTGFRFDTKNPSGHFEAENFYNAGNINCGIGVNAIFLPTGVGILGSIFGFGGIYVWATNVVNSGTFTIGADGRAVIQGHNVDLTRGTVTMQNSFLNVLLGQTNTSTIFATGKTGRNTNDWSPEFSLTPTTATASPPPVPLTIPFPLTAIFSLTNSTPFFSVITNQQTNVIVRMVFIQNDSTNVPYHVYFTNAFNTGFATIEWVGNYIDAISGQPATHYLYLTDDYILGSSTNILSYASPGIPLNFGLFISPTAFPFGPPEASSYPSIFGPNQPFPPGEIVTTNIYSYVDAQLAATTVSTNSVVGGALTNLPGRIEITATNELNLSLTSMSGMNYLLLRSTNNFDYDGQSQISAPYSDIYLGRTNGTMAVTNLLLPYTPFFSGVVQAWNTRWIFTDTNAVVITTNNGTVSTNNGMNYDYRLLIVEDNLSATSLSQEQDVVLYSSNNLVISDALNITRTFFSSCTNLVLSLNDINTGANSLDGELNLNSLGISWSNSLPRLRCLTNNGTIHTLNLANYGSATVPYFALINTGTISNGAGATIYASNFENGGPFGTGSGSFSLRSLTTRMTNGSITAGGAFLNVSGSFLVSNTVMQIGKSMTLIATNLLTDGDTTNNFWSLGANNTGNGQAFGLNLSVKPINGDLLGTTITNIAPNGSAITNIWAGQDRGYSNTGFSNNAAIGQLACDSKGTDPHTLFYFFGPLPGQYAIYVDNLILLENATVLDGDKNVKSFMFSNNIVIYYAQATINGVSAAEKLNHKNGDHLRWLPTYAGHFSSTTVTNADGTTSVVNAALAASPIIDSDGDGIPNGADPTPFFAASQISPQATVTNLPPKSVRVQWTTVANGTNYIFYKTNLLSPTWLPFTNFSRFYWGANMSVSNYAHSNFFPSPQPYPSPATNVWIYDAVTNAPHFYQIAVQPWLTYPF